MRIFGQFNFSRKCIAELLFRHNCQNVQRTSKHKGTVAVQRGLRKGSGNPAGLFVNTWLCATLLPFPVVKAWPVYNKGNADGGPLDIFKKTLRLKNTGDKALVEALYKADHLYKTGDPSDYKEILTTLLEHRDKKEPELQWRLARMIYESAKKSVNAEEKAKLMHDGFELVTQALEMDDENFAVHKWMAILLNEVSTLKSLKEQIIQSVNVKKHITRAVELNPNDPTSHYMLGSWCFSVASVPWYQRKLAATLFATPPESTFDEALKHFLDAEDIKPDFYSMNHLMLAKTYIILEEFDTAFTYLKFVLARKIVTSDDFDAKAEAVELAKKHFLPSQYLDEEALL